MNSEAACVYVVDDDVAIGESMKWLIESIGLQARIFSDPVKFLETYNSDCPDGCLLLDIRMPHMSGLEIQKVLAEKGYSLPIIFITSHHDVHLAVQAMKAGAIDFLLKPVNEQQLLDAINRGIRIEQNLREKAQDRIETQKRINTLSKRENQVLKLVISGKLNKNIASELGISTKTVELHRSNIMKKMKARSLAALVSMYVLYQNHSETIDSSA